MSHMKKFMPDKITKESKENIISVVKDMIEMYSDIGKGYLVTEWVCLCEAVWHEDGNSINERCSFCPARTTIKNKKGCMGPGGMWRGLDSLVNFYHTEYIRGGREEEIKLDEDFREELKEFLEGVNWNHPRQTTLKNATNKARYWTVERLQKQVKKKAKAWKSWLKEFRKVEV